MSKRQNTTSGPVNQDRAEAPEGSIPFDPAETEFKSRMAFGHLIRSGHDLTGYYVETEPGIHKLIRTCGCE